MPGKQLVPNPFTEITIEKVKRRAERAEMLVTVRGKGVRSLVVDRKKDPEFFEVVHSIFNSKGKKLKLSLSETHFKRLKTLGYLIDPETIPIPVGFRCSLGDPQLDLVPRWFHAELEARAASPDLIVHPTLQCDENPTQLPKGFAPTHAMAWVQDLGTGFRYPYWLDNEWFKIVRNLTPGEPASDLTESVRRRLAHANILTPANDPNPRAWKAVLEQARQHLDVHKYAFIPDVIWPFHLSSLRRYARDIAKEGFLKLGDPLVKLRLVRHNEPVISYFHAELRILVERLTGKKLKTSYNYIGAYLPGANLKKHTDRKNSDYAVNIHLDFQPEPIRESPWPLFLESPSGKAIPIHFSMGDLLIYRGTQMPHFRKKLDKGMRSTSFFVFFVSENFKGPVD